MRKLGVAVILLITLATHNVIAAGVARRQYCEGSFREVFLAARQAVHDVGARIVHSDEMGNVVGRIDAEDYGHAIEISVWMTRDRDTQLGKDEPIWVQVKAYFKKLKDPDEEQREQLKLLEDHVFHFIASRAACGAPH